MRGVAAAVLRSASRGDRLHRAHPPGSRRRHQGSDPDQDQHGQGDCQVYPGWDIEPSGAVNPGGPGEQRQGQQVPQQRAAQAARHGRHRHLAGVGTHDLAGGEADALQDADPAVAGHHGAADHVSHDQYRHDQPDHPEGDQERHERRYVLGLLGLDRQADLAEFLDALDRVAAGGSALDPEVVAKLLARSRHPLGSLTARACARAGARAWGRPGWWRGRRPAGDPAARQDG